MTLVSTILSAPPVGEGLREKRAERECAAGLRACEGQGETLLGGKAGEDFPVQSGLSMS